MPLKLRIRADPRPPEGVRPIGYRYRRDGDDEVA